MNVEDINRQLSEIYSSLMLKYSQLPNVTEGRNQEPGKDILTFPYLLQLNSDFENSDKCIVVFGQESNGWGDKEFRFWGDIIDFSCLPEAARIKLKFFPSLIGGNNEEECIENLKMSLMALYNYQNINNFNGNVGAYKNFYSFLREQSHLHGYSIIRNNLAKIGYRYNVKGNDTNLNLQLLDFVIKELELLNPDLLIFLTGTQDQYRILFKAFLSYFYEKIEDDYLEDNKPDKSDPVKKLNPISINGKQVKILWSYHPMGAQFNRVHDKMKEEYAQAISDLMM